MPDFPSQPLSPRARRAIDRVASEGDQSGGGHPYRLRRDEPTADGLRRVARDQLADAVANLRDSERDRATAVHEARKDLKKVRAVLRLTRERLGDDRYRAQNRRLRDAGRALAEARDAQVKLETLHGVESRFGSEAPEAAVQDLAERLRRDIERVGDGGDADLREAADRAIAEIEAGMEEVSDWPLSGKGWKLVKAGLVRSYARGRAAFEKTLASPTAPTVHEWRKRVKDLWYHLRLVRESWPEVLDALIEEAHELADLLGDHHDLEVLADDVRARDLPEEERTALVELTERRQEELLERAIPLGERVYAEKPADFKRRIRRYWRAWRTD
jgi:CHAD domain-containing protein